MEKKLYTLIVHSENIAGLLNQITAVFTRRQLNIESLNASASSIKGIHRYTITTWSDEDTIIKVTRQIEKKIDVLKVFCYTPNEVVLQELALYKVKRSRNVEDLVRRHNVRILDIHDEYIVLEKTGHRDEIRELYKMLSPYGVIQFVCSGQVAIIKSRSELLDEYLSVVNEKQRQLNSTK